MKSGGVLLGDGEVLCVAVGVVDHEDGERAAGTFGDGSAFLDVFQGDLELVAAGAGVVEGAVLRLEVQVFDFDFIVNLSRHATTIMTHQVD